MMHLLRRRAIVTGQLRNEISSPVVRIKTCCRVTEIVSCCICGTMDDFNLNRNCGESLPEIILI